MKRKVLLKLLLSSVFLLLGLFFAPSTFAQSVDLTQFIGGAGFISHEMSIGGSISYTRDGGPGPGTPVREYQGGTYRQLFVSGSGIFRREDTSWAPLPGFGDAFCQDGGKAIYTLESGCNQYQPGDSITNDGVFWAPAVTSVGSSWNTPSHQIITIREDAAIQSGERRYCSLSNLSGYAYPQACGQSASLRLDAFYSAGEFTFCTGITNTEDLVKIVVTAGPGTGDTFYYMRNWGLVGFEAPGFQGAIHDPLDENSNPSACGGSQDRPGQFSLNRAQCNQTDDPEYHALRPYPAAVCNANIEEAALLCGNDLIMKQAFEVTPQDAVSCQATESGSTLCTYNVESTIGFSVNTSNSSLPIMGNTELVPNRETPYPGGILNSVQRLNEYVSWYLNGANFNAMDPPILDDLYTKGQRTVATIPEPTYRLVNLSGPLNKLLPWRIQIAEKLTSALDAAISKSGTLGIRHDQIVACAIRNYFPGGADYLAPCYSGRTDTNFRLSLWDDPSNQPPVEEDYQTIPEFWEAFKEWRGSTCIDLPFGLKYCTSFAPQYFRSAAFSYLPYSSTEDRKGYVSVGNSGFDFSTATGNEINVNDLQIEFPLSGNNFETLYFAHMLEASELADTLQRTFAPGWTPALSGTEDFYEIPPNCEFVDTRRNPGDDLYGELEELQEEKQIRGELAYSGEFVCEFQTEFDEERYLSCVEGYSTNPDDFLYSGFDPETMEIGSYCGTLSTTSNTCTKNAVFGFKVQTGTPKAHEVWERLVDGPLSVVKRFFPKEGVESPVSKYEPIPAETSVSYSASNLFTAGVPTPRTETFAGSVFSGKPGSAASLYFPYIGGVYDYFIKGIQKALRPKGFDFAGGAGSGGISPTETAEVNCNAFVTDDEVASLGGSKFLGSFKENVIRIADQWLTDDSNTHHARECYNDVVKRSLQAGVNPAFTLTIWLNESDASNYDGVPRSDLQDFGINLASMYKDFNAQITRFLSLAQEGVYRSTYPQCFQNSYSDIINFMRIFHLGTRSCTELDENRDLFYYKAIFGTLAGGSTTGPWQFVAGGCSIPSYPTDNSCP